MKLADLIGSVMTKEAKQILDSANDIPIDKIQNFSHLREKNEYFVELFFAKTAESSFSPFSLDSQEISKSLRTINYKREYINISCGCIYDHGFAVMLFQRQHLVLINLSLLKFHTAGRLQHQGLVMLDDLTSSASEHGHDLINIGIIILLRNTSHAATETFLYVKIQTWTYLAAKNHI